MSRLVLRKGLSAIGRVFASLVEELFVAAGVALVAIGFWDWWRPGAYLVPGIVLLWLFVPQRERFVAPRPPVTLKPRRKDV